MRERDFQTQVLQLAKLTGWRTYHTYNSRRSAAGFPDLVLVCPPRLIFAELKSEVGKPTREQREWLEALAECTQPPESYLWRPGNWPEIARTLVKVSYLKGEST